MLFNHMFNCIFRPSLISQQQNRSENQSVDSECDKDGCDDSDNDNAGEAHCQSDEDICGENEFYDEKVNELIGQRFVFFWFSIFCFSALS